MLTKLATFRSYRDLKTRLRSASLFCLETVQQLRKRNIGGREGCQVRGDRKEGGGRGMALTDVSVPNFFLAVWGNDCVLDLSIVNFPAHQQGCFQLKRLVLRIACYS